ncbi:MAG: bifunctional 2-polyprenyl-6-hydroxyphenol methylase/3-demethylubiquinol 3-O-methyltransferase UbiG [Oxalobacter formigenes]|nr:bifunctional 2-polyprenyl-6-hydroxyphenol methylase/3-demethylubiquinol 3-O-methyltransferase UbiG [Oxalobacter formigenes]
MKFNASPDAWWNRQGTFRFLHELNPLRLQWMENLSSLRGKKVLDIGCGGGILSEALAKRGAKVTGIDLAPQALQAACIHMETSGLPVDYRLISAETLAQKTPAAYDIVACLEMLEHVPDPASIVSAAARLVKPNGTVYFATLNRTLKSFLYAIAGAEYVLGLLPKGTHRYDRFLSPAELSQFIRQAGMTVTAITGITGSLAAWQFHLSQDVSVNYMTACRPL